MFSWRNKKSNYLIFLLSGAMENTNFVSTFKQSGQNHHSVFSHYVPHCHMIMLVNNIMALIRKVKYIGSSETTFTNAVRRPSLAWYGLYEKIQWAFSRVFLDKWIA